MNNETNKPSAAAMKASKGLFPPGEYTEGTILSTAFYIDAELSAERKAAEEMRNLLKTLEPMIEDEYPNSATVAGVLVAAYDAARKGEG